MNSNFNSMKLKSETISKLNNNWNYILRSWVRELKNLRRKKMSSRTPFWRKPENPRKSSSSSSRAFWIKSRARLLASTGSSACAKPSSNRPKHKIYNSSKCRVRKLDRKATQGRSSKISGSSKTKMDKIVQVQTTAQIVILRIKVAKRY